ncbi:hypothetical protein D5O23_06750 [Salmonella enterica subsp. enterica]|nr:hypothetical protein [Salmonella enterica subsp. enterica serovar Mokola]EBU9959577.1 hypothetical protein [Salmonella enterica subsp. enterica serovar Onireke]EBV0502213.1 hypothetical protein [Salmonella enterica subsp. enterica serovar Teddington]EBZ5189228.1 hypothetical protein [Salmonella enterica subsp. enterica serovar Wangata]ECI4031195.1 hypothetical protein [Salmonella enterica subsp. enterica]
MRLLILLHTGYRKRLIIRIAKNSLFNVVNEISQRYFLFLFFRCSLLSAAIYTSKRINLCVRLVANVVRWLWLSPVSQQCRGGS